MLQRQECLFNCDVSKLFNLKIKSSLVLEGSGVSGGGGALGANALPSKYHVPFSDETEI